MSGTLASPIDVAPCECEENEQLRHRNNSLQKRLDYLTDMMDENENELISFVEENEALRQRNYHLEANNKKLRQDFEILEESYQLHADINALIDLSKPFKKDEPTEKKVKEVSDAEVQTEDFGDLEDGYAVGTTIEMIETLYQELKAKQVAIEKELGSTTQKMTMVTERLGVELEAKQALQAEFNRLEADQGKFFLRKLRDKQRIEELEDLYRKAVEQNEKLHDEMENQELVTFGSTGVLYQKFRSLDESFAEANSKQNKIGQRFRSLDESFKEAIAKQNEDDQMIADVLKKQEQARTCGCFKSLLLNESKICLRCRILVFRSTVRAVTHSLFSVFQKLF